jgi:UPF0042 nucleotide-binding protein
MAIRIVSFGLKHNHPPTLDPGDTLIDVRFYGLPNAYVSGVLRNRPGTDPVIQEAIEESNPYALALRDLVSQWHQTPGILYVACYGGRHRSVAMAELLSKHLKTLGYDCPVQHRDLPRTDWSTVDPIPDYPQDKGNKP